MPVKKKSSVKKPALKKKATAKKKTPAAKKLAVKKAAAKKLATLKKKATPKKKTSTKKTSASVKKARKPATKKSTAKPSTATKKAKFSSKTTKKPAKGTTTKSTSGVKTKAKSSLKNTSIKKSRAKGATMNQVMAPISKFEKEIEAINKKIIKLRENAEKDAKKLLDSGKKSYEKLKAKHAKHIKRLADLRNKGKKKLTASLSRQIDKLVEEIDQSRELVNQTKLKLAEQKNAVTLAGMELKNRISLIKSCEKIKKELDKATAQKAKDLANPDKSKTEKSKAVKDVKTKNKKKAGKATAPVEQASEALETGTTQTPIEAQNTQTEAVTITAAPQDKTANLKTTAAANPVEAISADAKADIDTQEQESDAVDNESAAESVQQFSAQNDLNKEDDDDKRPAPYSF